MTVRGSLNPERNDEPKPRNAYRIGKIGQTIYFSLEADRDLERLRLGSHIEGVRTSKTKLIERALDDLFERAGYPRHFGTQGEDE